MNVDKTGTIISRATGVALIAVGSTSLLQLLQPATIAPASWMSYAPSNASRDLMTTLHDTYFVMTNSASLYVPSLALTLAGFIMILLSRPIGRWLAKGLQDKQQ